MIIDVDSKSYKVLIRFKEVYNYDSTLRVTHSSLLNIP